MTAVRVRRRSLTRLRLPRLYLGTVGLVLWLLIDAVLIYLLARYFITGLIAFAEVHGWM